jgi:hypothetical protein
VPIAHGYRPGIRYEKVFQFYDLASFPRLSPATPERDALMLLDESGNSPSDSVRQARRVLALGSWHELRARLKGADLPEVIHFKGVGTARL